MNRDLPRLAPLRAVGHAGILADRFVIVSVAFASGLLLSACGGEAPAEASASLGQSARAFVNGEDDRLEYFQLGEAWEREALEQFTVVLMRNDTAAAVSNGHVALLPTWGDVNRLCDGEPFGEQPAAAFCSGVLVDWDLVLTSGHCVNVPEVPLEDLRIAFNYYYREAGELAMTDNDVYAVERVIVARRDEASPNDSLERLDYAWIELEEPVHPPHRPAPIHRQRRGMSTHDPVISIGAGGGVPLKWDDGGHVQALRSDIDDYFIADTDTSQGSSGGGIFDGGLAVLGTLARGAADFERTAAGCYVTSSETDPSLAREQFTYAHRAVEALCETGSASLLCEPTWAEPCDAGAFDLVSRTLDGDSDGSGCALQPSTGARRAPFALLGSALLALSLRRRGRRSSSVKGA